MRLRHLSAATAAAFFATIAGSHVAQADECLQRVTHWGNKAYSVSEARANAYAGMDWKIRNRMGDTVRIVGNTSIRQCKQRSGGLWQCQAQVVRDYCL